MNDPVEKSRQLLIDNLTLEQRHEFEIAGKFTVKIKDEIYEIKPEITERISDGWRYCAVIPDLPVYDQMLARKLYLENNPGSFFKAANLFPFPHVPRFQRTQDTFTPQSRVAECDSWLPYFRVAIMHECERCRMDSRLIDVRIFPNDFNYAYQIDVRYADRWNVRMMLDAEHMTRGNLADILRIIAEDCVARLSDLRNNVRP